MKRIVIAVTLMLMLSACASGNVVSAPKTDVPYNTTVSKDYELVFSSYRQGNTVVYYPEIAGLYDEDKQDILNEEMPPQPHHPPQK